MNKNFMGIFKKGRRLKACIVLCMAFFVFVVFMPQNVDAHSCPCGLCNNQCANVDIPEDHQNIVRDPVTNHISTRFNEHRAWLLGTFFTEQILPALMLFTEQMSAVAMQQTMIIGSFLDAKHQLETQRLLQELQVEAHKDYQPSEDFCWFGTGVRSMANTEQRGRANAYVLARRQNARQLGELNMGGAPDGDQDKRNRWETFLELFCDPQDSNWVSGNAANSGLAPLCNPAPGFPEFTNADIDYTRLIDNERTISLLDGDFAYDFADNVSPTTGSVSVGLAERAVMALQNNLYGHDIIERVKDQARFKDPQYQNWYMALRSVVAKRSVAENSFNAIVGLKSAGTTDDQSTVGPFGSGPIYSDTYTYLGAIMVELGIPAAEIPTIIGERPSYYAQLELLAKKIYQNPDFYANLYDKPANVKRKSVALKAIELMVDRAIYESQVRQEMLTSVLLSARLNEPFKEAEKGLVPR